MFLARSLKDDSISNSTSERYKTITTLLSQSNRAFPKLQTNKITTILPRDNHTSKGVLF